MKQADNLLKVSQLAESWGVAGDKIRGWLASGELAGINLAAKPSGRPRWRIRASDAERFLQRRQTIPAVSQPRKRQPTNRITEYF